MNNQIDIKNNKPTRKQSIL